MKKIVIVEVINALISRAGAEVFFCNLCAEMKKNKNVDLHVVILYGGVHESFLSFFVKNNIKIHVLNKKRGLDFKAAKDLRNLIKIIQPDIINSHLNFFSTYFFAFGFKKHKWHIFHTVHSIAEKEIDFFSKIVRPIYIMKKKLSFIGISDLISKSILELHKKASVYTIYNGIKLRNLIPQTSNKNKFDFICVARFSKQKNHPLLLKAFNELYKTNPTLTLLCLGNGELKDEIIEFSQTLECVKNISFIDLTNDVYPYLQSSSVFVLSSFYEGNPISILEAMDVGLTIVAPRIGGIPDVLEDKKNGFMFKPNSLCEIIDTMKLAISLSDEERSFISCQNKEKIKQYSIEHIALKYFETFCEVTCYEEKN